jgi:hypothetical protein
VQVGLADLDRGAPAFQFLLPVATGHHLGEAGHVSGQGIQVRAAGADTGELGLLRRRGGGDVRTPSVR